jgi:hypothetical protein
MKRSQGLDEARFMSAPSGKMTSRTHIPHRTRAGGSGAISNPARCRTTRAASTQTPTATALAMRRAGGSCSWVPPQAALPRGAPDASAAWKADYARKPIAAATAAVPLVSIWCVAERRVLV